jgi:hypothetical protein
MKLIPLFFLTALPLSAATITQWNFNSAPADASDATGTTAPSIGTGTASLRSTTGLFANGNAGTGSTDPTAADDSGWGVTSFPASGSDMTAGVQFLIDTTGYESITISYDVRHSNTSSRYQAVQYTLNGSSWTTAAFFTAAAGDAWINNRSVNLSAISGANNNPDFGFRILSASQLAATGAGSAGYVAATTGSTYAASGNWRFDMVTVSGSVIPEPSAALLGGLGVLGLLRRRR